MEGLHVCYSSLFLSFLRGLQPKRDRGHSGQLEGGTASCGLEMKIIGSRVAEAAECKARGNEPSGHLHQGFACWLFLFACVCVCV